MAEMGVTGSAERMRRLREKRKAEALPPGLDADGLVIAARLEREIRLGDLGEWVGAVWARRVWVLVGREDAPGRSWKEIGGLPIGGRGLPAVEDDGRRLRLEAVEGAVERGLRDVWPPRLWVTKLAALIERETGQPPKLGRWTFAEIQRFEQIVETAPRRAAAAAKRAAALEKMPPVRFGDLSPEDQERVRERLSWGKGAPIEPRPDDMIKASIYAGGKEAKP